MLHDIEVHPSSFSDHFPITFHLPWKRPSAPRKHVQLRKYKDIDLVAFSEDIRNSPLIQSPPQEDITDLMNLYDKTLSCILEKHAPATVKTIINRSESPWYTDEVKKAKQDL